MSQGRLLVLGNLKGAALAALDVARKDLGYEATLLSRADDAIAKLDLPSLRALVVDLTTPGAARFCHEARARRALFNVPLIALSPKLSDLAFSNALRWGADDVVALGAVDPLRARLEAIPEFTAPLAMATRGDAVIADPERSRCDVLGRVLANAGFNVKYATDPVATRFYLSKANVRLFVVNSELGNPAPLIAESRAAGSQADWVITTKTLTVDSTREELRGLDKVVVMPSHGPPENVLFAINLLQPSTEARKRSEVRALYATVVLFRPVGLDRDEFAFTYSVSAGGLYLRTLLKPPSERLWIELNPPNVARRVKLLAEVAWARTFGQPGAETAPPGFGIQIVDGLGDDLTLWRQGFASLDAKSPSHQSLPEVRTSMTSFRVPLPSKPPTRGPSMLPRGSSLRPNQNSLAPGAATATGNGAVPGGMLAGAAPRGSWVPERLRSLAPGESLSEAAAKPGTGDRPSKIPGEVVVPHSTWTTQDFLSAAPSVELPRPPTRSSQSAVLAALRTSLVPRAPEQRALDNTPDNAVDARDAQAALDATQRLVPDLPPLKLDPSARIPTESVQPSNAAEADASAARQQDAARPNVPRVTEARTARTVLGVGQAPIPHAGPVPAPPSLDEWMDGAEAAMPSRPAITPAEPSVAPAANPADTVVAAVAVAPAAAAPVTFATPDPAAAKADIQSNAAALARTQPSAAHAERPSWPDDDSPTAVRDDPRRAPATDAPPAGSTQPSAQVSARDQAAITLQGTGPSRAEAQTQPADATVLVNPPPGGEEESTAPAARVRRRSSDYGAQAASKAELGRWQDETSAPATSDLSRSSPPVRKGRAGLMWSALAAAALTVVGLLVVPPLYRRWAEPVDPRASTTAVLHAAPTLSAHAGAEAVTTQNGDSQRGDTKLGEPQLGDSPSPRAEASPEPAASINPETAPSAALAAPVVSDEVAPVTQPASPTPQTPPDGSKLPEDTAYLFVRSPIDATVFVHGVAMGRTNEWIQSRCGFRFLRLGSSPGAWLSEGKPSKLRCRHANEVELAPTPD